MPTPTPSVEATKVDTSTIETADITKVETPETEVTSEPEAEVIPETTPEVPEEEAEEVAEEETTEEETDEPEDEEEEDEKTKEEAEKLQLQAEIQTLKDNLNMRPEETVLNIKKVHASNESYREENLEMKQDLKDKEKELAIVNRRLDKREAELDERVYDDFDKGTVELAKTYRPLLKTIQKFETSGDMEDYKKAKLYLEDLAENKGLINKDKYLPNTTPQKTGKVSNLFD